jgi:hypothetical protein
MNQDRYKPPIRVLPNRALQSAAAALVREAQGETAEREEQLQSEFFGQQAGVPGMGDAPELRHEPGASVLANKLLHPAFQIMEREYRALPEQGWFTPDVNPKRPIEFQLGSFEVPRNQALWLTDYQFQVFRPSGVDPGDFVVAAPGRFSNQIGFDISARGKRQSNISYQLDPQPVFQGRPEYQPQITPPSGFFAGPGPGTGAADPFNNAAARTFASTASPGTSLLPRRPNVQGPRGGPFTFVVGEGAAVSLNVVIFNALTSPIAAIGGRLAGYLLHVNLSSALLQRVRPR